MAGRAHVKRITKALDLLDGAKSHSSRLDAARKAREAAESLEHSLIADGRKAGMTWAEVGKVYGLTKQGAQQRFG